LSRISTLVLILAAVLSGCGCRSSTVVSGPIDIPVLDAVRPVAPVLEPVEITEPVPSPLLRNYAMLIQYADDLEDYAWGGTEPGGLELYIQNLKDFIFTNH